MSVLETPRILFRGNMSWDPVTTNNYPALYDEDVDRTVYPDAQPPTIQAKVAQFRKDAIADVDPNGTGPRRSWNPHGSYRSSFYDEDSPDSAAPESSLLESCISGVDLGQGPVCDDPFVGVPARFTGMLVDLEPYGSYSSQLFFDTMTFGIDGGCRIAAKCRLRAIARYINFSRNPVGYIAGVASVIWQTSFLKRDLVIDAFDSPALQALAAALDQDGVLGLTVRWNIYRTIYYDTAELATNPALAVTKAQQLMAKLQGGGFQPNPARSKMVGVIGLYREDEPFNEPGDRVLIPGSSTSPVASAFARLGDSRLTVDLGNSISETGLDLAKQDLGELEIVAVDPQSRDVVASLGTLAYGDYDREAYEAGSGIVTLDVDSGEAAKAVAADLELRQADGTVLLAEAPLRAVARWPNLYIDQGGVYPAFWTVYERGALAPPGIELTFYMLNPDGKMEGSFPVITYDDGATGFVLRFSAGLIVSYVPAFASDPPPTQGIDTQANTYLYVRVLAADAELAQMPPTWDNVYANVLANWNAMAPCMDNWLDLADEARVKAYGPLIKNLTGPAAFESYRYMPVTRDMTHGQRVLLYNFLDGVEFAPEPVPAEALTEGVIEESPLTKASKAMRSD